MTDIDTILSIQSNVLKSFDENQAVAAIRRLLWAEVGRLELSTSRVTSSLSTKIADHGIDAAIDGPIRSDSVLAEGSTWYQIKAGHKFAPWRKSDLKEELWAGRPKTKEGLGKELRRCLEQKGRYVLITFGHDLTKAQRIDAVELLKKYLGDCDYKDPKVDVLGIEQIIGLAQRYPSLALELTGRNNLEFLPYQTWSRSANMGCQFHTETVIEELVGEIRSILREPRPRHIRITGEPGIGKTRLVLEALRDEDLANRVVYCPHAEHFRQSQLMRELLRSDSNLNAIVVLDDCSRGDRAEVWNHFSSYRDRLSLVTLSHDPDTAQDDGLVQIAAPTLSDELIGGILQGYSDEQTRIHVHRWVSLCEGSPRVAHLIGRNLRANPDDVLAPLSTSNVWERFVIGQDNGASQRVEQRWVVLRYVALFRRFGFQPPVESEARVIADLVREADPNITWHRFREIICELRRRRIIQGTRTLRIVPRALHVWLWIQWWRIYGGGFHYAEFTASLGRELKRWFAEMFIYAGASPESASAAGALLRPNGAISGVTISSAEGAAFFRAVAEACPEEAVRFLERTFVSWTDEQIRSFGGRRNVLRALEKIVVWRRLFRRAAMLILRFAENESERYSNNSTGMFIALFAPSPGGFSMTEAPPRERLPVLREILLNSEGIRREIALKACDSGLETRGFFRMIGAEHQGLRRQPELWYPETHEEYAEAYIGVWELVVETYESFSGDIRDSAAKILIDRSLTLLSNLRESEFPMILSMLDRLAAEKTYSRQIVSLCLDAPARWSKCLTENSLLYLSQIHDRVVGSSLEAQIRRYVGMNVRQDWLGKGVSWSEGQKLLRQKIKSLAESCLDNLQVFKSLLPWLSTAEAERAEMFGEELSSLPDGLNWLPAAWDSFHLVGAEGHLAFIVGLYRSLRRLSEEEWQKDVAALLEDSHRRKWVPMIIRCSGELTEWGAQRVIALIETGIVSIFEISRWRWGDNFGLVSRDTFVRWLDVLLDSSEAGATTLCLGLIAASLHWTNDASLDTGLSSDLVERVLHLTFPGLNEERESDHDHEWAEVARHFIEAEPARSGDLFEFCFEHMFGTHHQIDLAHKPQNEVLRNIFRAFPERCWELVCNKIKTHETEKYTIFRWLRGETLGFDGSVHEGLLGVVPREVLWCWVDQSIEDRACLLARNVPQTLNVEDGALTRELLNRYGDLESVRNSLFSNFGCTGWRGSAALNYRSLRLLAEEWRAETTEPRILHWIDLYLESLGENIERSETEEERRNW